MIVEILVDVHSIFGKTQLMHQIIKRVLATLLLITLCSAPSQAGVVVFQCTFKDSFQFYVTIYDDGSPARIGMEQGVGSKAQPFFDKATGAWILVEFMSDGRLPSTLTTILEDGTVWHSRHTLSIGGTILPSQQEGKCGRKAIN